jgi:hypothetical protein
LNAVGLTRAWTAWSVQPVPARARASALVPPWRQARVPSVTTDQLPPLVDQPEALPSWKSSLN